jgi:hypothetical protein
MKSDSLLKRKNGKPFDGGGRRKKGNGGALNNDGNVV